ncbi:MAG: TetR/AcrR family transcriptional regulator [Pseudomonadota bacterium]
MLSELKKPEVDALPLSDGRQALLAAALKAFAEFGMNGVSLRAITAQAGQLNQSAVRYHFRDKDGLVAAVLADVMAELAPHKASALAQLQARAEDQPWTARELTEVMCRPFLFLFLQGPIGLQRIRFLSRLTWQEGGKGQAILVAALQPYFMHFVAALLLLSPGKPAAAMALHAYLTVNTLIHGLADASLLQAQPVFGLDTLQSTHPGALLDYFYNYLAGGLGS